LKEEIEIGLGKRGSEVEMRKTRGTCSVAIFGISKSKAIPVTGREGHIGV
jgi:hypothetical protein